MFSNMQLGRWQQRLLSSDGLSLLVTTASWLASFFLTHHKTNSCPDLLVQHTQKTKIKNWLMFLIYKSINKHFFVTSVGLALGAASATTWWCAIYNETAFQPHSLHVVSVYTTKIVHGHCVRTYSTQRLVLQCWAELHCSSGAVHFGSKPFDIDYRKAQEWDTLGFPVCVLDLFNRQTRSHPVWLLITILQITVTINIISKYLINHSKCRNIIVNIQTMSHPVWLLNKQSAQHQRRNEVQPNKAWALEWKAQMKQSRHDRYVMCSVVDFGPGCWFRTLKNKQNSQKSRWTK